MSTHRARTLVAASQPFVLQRPVLLERLEHALERRVALIFAPPGYGKTVALGQLAAMFPTSHLRVRLRGGDHDPLVLARHLADQLSADVPALSASAGDALTVAMRLEDPIPQLLEWAEHHLGGAERLFIIDDAHHALQSPAGSRFITGLIDRSNNRFVIASRAQHDLPVSSWLAYGTADSPIDVGTMRWVEDDVRRYAQEAEISTPRNFSNAILQRTAGWPLAIAWAFRLLERGADFDDVCRDTEVLAHEVLAEQLFRSLSPADQNLLLNTCLAPKVDVDLAGSLGFEDAALTLTRLRKAITFIEPIDTRFFRYHDLFRSFLDAELRRRGVEQYRLTAIRTAHVLIERNELVDALTLLDSPDMDDARADLLVAVGLPLLSQGKLDVVSSALSNLADDKIAASPVLTSLKASVEANLGRLDRADALFQLAINNASGEVAHRITHRFAATLARRDDERCVDLLRPMIAEPLPVDLEVTTRGLLGAALALRGEVIEARQHMDRALSLARHNVDDRPLAETYFHASFVAWYSGDYSECEKLASNALSLARERGYSSIAARALSVLYILSHDHAGDMVRSLWCLEQWDREASAAGDRELQASAVIGIYSIAVESADDVGIQRAEERVRALDTRSSPRTLYAMLPADAMRAAWRRDFAFAYSTLAGTADKMPTAERRALRWSEIALYAALASRRAEADEAIRESIANWPRERYRTRLDPRLSFSLVNLVIAYTAQHRWASAQKLLADLERRGHHLPGRSKALIVAIRTLYGYATTRHGGEEELISAMEGLRKHHLGGYARLIEAMGTPRNVVDGALSELTEMELRVLRHLATGAATKDIADTLGRGVRTIDSHVARILRKLQCHSRGEAVAYARDRGLLRNLS